MATASARNFFNLRKQNLRDFSFKSLTQNFVLCLYQFVSLSISRHKGILNKYLVRISLMKMEWLSFCGDSNIEEGDEILKRKATGFKSAYKLLEYYSSNMDMQNVNHF